MKETQEGRWEVIYLDRKVTAKRKDVEETQEGRAKVATGK